MKVLIACEESQEVCKAFRKLGHEAYSCDILPCSGGHPEWHIQDNVLFHLDEGWDMMIAHPPCTYLTVTGNRWFNVEKYGKKAIERKLLRTEAIIFFIALFSANIPLIAIENPVGVMSTRLRKPDQIIQPYQFGHKSRKTTCLWLKNLPKLKPTEVVKPDLITYKDGSTFSRDYMEGVKRSKAGESELQRSKTFRGIAQAMAEQWSVENKLIEEKEE